MRLCAGGTARLSGPDHFARPQNNPLANTPRDRYPAAMAYDYDKLFAQTPNALGQPTALFVDFFARHAPNPCRVLDIGCGQGRDTLFIARAGHTVVGVDLSPNGIRDLMAAALNEQLAVDGIVADITTFAPPGAFDIILIDRTLHMLAKAARFTVLARLLDHVTPTGWVLIADERANISGFQQVFADHRAAWQTERARGGTLFMRRV